MTDLRHIEPRIVENAPLIIKGLYYTNTLSVSVSKQVKEDISLAHQDCVLFYFVEEEILRDVIEIRLDYLLQHEEVWIPRIVTLDVYMNDAFDDYTFYYDHPFLGHIL